MVDDLETPVTDKTDEFSISNCPDLDPTTRETVDSLNVPVGDSAMDFSIGDYLNAIDAVTCYFQNQRQQTDDDLVAALRLYATCIDEEVELP